jgi:hypothetical protein
VAAAAEAAAAAAAAAHQQTAPLAVWRPGFRAIAVACEVLHGLLGGPAPPAALSAQSTVPPLLVAVLPLLAAAVVAPLLARAGARLLVRA